MFAARRRAIVAVASLAVTGSTFAGAGAPTDPTFVSVPGSAVMLKLWSEVDATGGSVPHYAISLGGEFSEARATSYEIKLHHGDFDPLARAPAIEAGFEAEAGGGLYIVQYLTHPLAAYRQAVRQAGGEVLSFLANHSHVVRMDPQARAAVEAMPFVRWVGALHPAFRLEPAVIDAIVAGELNEAARDYNIHVTRAGIGEKQIVADRIGGAGGRVESLSPHGHFMSVTLSLQQLMDVIRMDEVLYVDRRFPPQTYLNNVRADGGANEIEILAGYTGIGVRAEVIDSGLLLTHQAWTNPPLLHALNNANSSHGTSVFGCVFSDGTGNASGRGLIPDAQGIFSSFTGLGDRYVHTLELLHAPYNAVFQTNSWGSCCTTLYGTASAYMDLIIFDSDLVILQAQANTGNQSSDVSAWAKNVVSIGGIRHLDTLSRSDDFWGNAGSIGPATDGRIKPDFAYWYDSILTTSNSGGYTSSFGGTSAATPVSAGHFGLLFQMWADGIFGNEVVPGGTVFDNRPHMSTARALMVNSVEPYEFSGSNADLTRTHQGWGLPNVANLYDRRDNMFIVNEEDLLVDLQTITYKVVVAEGESSFRVTMVYMDPPGNPGSSVARINDVNLKVISPSGTKYWGNQGLRDGNVSTPNGVPSSVDPIENVWIEHPEAGSWTIQIIGREIIEDGHVETPEIDADFALVVTGGTAVDCPADIDGDGVVGVIDFLQVLAEWGQLGGPADVNADGVVDILDFLFVLAEWGPCS